MTDLLGCPFCGDPMVEGNEYYGHPKGSKCFLAFYCIPFGGDVSAWNTRAAIAAMNTASDNGRLRKALEAIRDHDMGDDLNSMECQSCHDKGFEHYWAIKKIARDALQHPAKEMGE